MSPNLIPDFTDGPCRQGHRLGAPELWFEDDGLSPRPNDPVFLVLYPTERAARLMVGLARHFRKTYDLPFWRTARERVHVTLDLLCYYGQLTDEWLAAIGEALTDLRMPPFLAGFDLVRIFGREKGKLVLCGGEGVTGITMLRDEIVEATRAITYVPYRCDFTPHITLNYKDCSVPTQLIDEIRWPVREVVLVCSLHGRGCHRVLRRWQLQRPITKRRGEAAYCTSALIAEAQASRVWRMSSAVWASDT